MRLRGLFPAVTLILILLLAVTLYGCAETAVEEEPETAESEPAEEPVVPEEETVVTFLAMPENGGTISGIATQTRSPRRDLSSWSGATGKRTPFTVKSG